MARDFENIHNIDELSDDELRGLVREHLAAHNGLAQPLEKADRHEGTIAP